mgnify:CR=1 FL=1
MKNTYKVILVVIVFIILLGVLAKVFNLEDKILKKIYPKTYEEYVEKYAKEYNVDPLLVFSIIKAESNFKKDAKSTSKAKGLMQIMDSTAKEIAKKNNIELTDENILDPEINIEIGTIYLSQLIEKYNSVELAIAAYNAGHGNVDKWISQDTLKEDGTDAENIPFKETNMYVRKVMRDWKIYKSILK